MPKTFLVAPRRMIFVAVALTAFAAPAFSQTAPEKVKRSPGEMATMGRAAIQNRATCTREAKAMKLGYFKRRSFIKNCMKR
jgi:hypothetical protein